MGIVIQHYEEVRFGARGSDHEVVIDLPESHGGQDRGMSPPQLFIAALGGCAGVYVADYCESRAIAYQGMRLALDWDYQDRPRRIASVRVRVELPSAALSDEQEQGIRQSVQQCLLHNTLAHRPEFSIEVVASDGGSDAARAAPEAACAKSACASGACCRAQA